MKSSSIIVFLMFFVGCVQNIPNSYLQLGGSERGELIDQECKEISLYGNILDHLKIISQSTDEILSLLHTKNPLIYQNRITELADTVKLKAALAHELSRPEWTNAKWFTRLGWSFFPDPIPGKWAIKNIQVETIYLIGDKRDDLSSKIEFWERNGWIYVNLERQVSSLEICQLQKTMMVVFKVKLAFGKKERSYFYNLYINPYRKVNYENS